MKNCNEEKVERRTVHEWLKAADQELERAVQKRVAIGNEIAVDALRELLRWVPECGFPDNIRPSYCEEELRKYAGRGGADDYRKDCGLDDPELPFCTEKYTYELWGKDDARTFLAHLGKIARALGLEGLHDGRLR